MPGICFTPRRQSLRKIDNQPHVGDRTLYRITRMWIFASRAYWERSVATHSIKMANPRRQLGTKVIKVCRSINAARMLEEAFATAM